MECFMVKSGGVARRSHAAQPVKVHELVCVHDEHLIDPGERCKVGSDVNTVMWESRMR